MFSKWWYVWCMEQKVKVTWLCLDSLQSHGLYSALNSPGKNTGVGGCSLLQGIFPTQRLNPGLPHCRQILYQLSYQGSQESVNDIELSRKDIIGSKRLYMNTSYNPECKFTLQQITPTTYVSPSHAFSAVTVKTQWESHGQRRLTGVHEIVKSWIQQSA